MAKKKKKKRGGPTALWLVTFSDLMTLLLTFFVLLLSMSSMDQSFLTRVTVYTADMGLLTIRGSGRVTAMVKEVVDILEKPWEALEKQNRIKDLLFPDDELPPEIDRQTLDENLQILAKPEGVALVLTDDLIFPTGRHTLSRAAKQILAKFVPILEYLTAPINVAGYTDDTPGRTVGNLELSGLRAMAVLQYFVSMGIGNDRFSVSAYGPNFPAAPNTTEEGRRKNRRVEILLRTVKPVGGYM